MLINARGVNELVCKRYTHLILKWYRSLPCMSPLIMQRWFPGRDPGLETPQWLICIASWLRGLGEFNFVFHPRQKGAVPPWSMGGQLKNIYFFLFLYMCFLWFSCRCLWVDGNEWQHEHTTMKQSLVYLYWTPADDVDSSSFAAATRWKCQKILSVAGDGFLFHFCESKKTSPEPAMRNRQR